MCIDNYIYKLLIIHMYIYICLLYVYPALQTKLEADENSQAVKKTYKTNSSEYWMDLYLSSTSRLHESIPLYPGRTSACGREIDLQSTLDRPGIRNAKHFISLYRKSEDVEIERTHGISSLGVCRLWKLGHGSLQFDIVLCFVCM